MLEILCLGVAWDGVPLKRCKTDVHGVLVDAFEH